MALQVFSFSSGTYLIHPDHRNATPNKSQWRITAQDEFGTFVHSEGKGWQVGGITGWGLHLSRDGRVTILGVAQDHKTDVFIAKFVRNPTSAQWHGYPVNQRD